jgi:hypothetical protein
MHPSLYQLARGHPDPDVLQVIFAGGVGMIGIVFAQYSFGMGICLDLDEAGAPALDPFTFDLPLSRRFFYVMLLPARSVARIVECFTR